MPTSSNLKIYILICFVIGLVFYPSLKFDFVTWDDPGHILNNPLVQTLNVKSIISIFSQTTNTTYIPLTILSFAVEHKLFGFNPFYFHLNNLLLHVLVTILVFGLGIKLGLRRNAALIASLLFGLHPMHVESVVWITERKDVLYSFFYLLSMHQWLKYIQHKKSLYFGLSLIFGLLSMLSKPMAVSLPLTLLLLDWFKQREETDQCLIEKIPFFITTLGLAWSTHLENHSAFAIESNLFSAILIFVWTFMFYIQSFFLPLNLMPIYKTPEPIHFTNGNYLLAVMTFILFIMVVFKQRKNRWFIFAVMFYLVMIFFLLRFGQLQDIDVVADRFMYLPSAGFCLLIGGWIDSRFQSLEKTKLQLAASTIMIGILFATLAYLAQEYSKVWQNSITLWNVVIEKSPKLSTAYINRSRIYIELNDTKAALEDCNQAIALNPSKLGAYINRSIVYTLTEKYDLALKDLDYILSTDRQSAESYLNRANLYARWKKTNEALSDYSRAIKLNPIYFEAYNQRGLLYISLNKYDLALQDFNYVIHNSSQYNEQAYLNRGIAFSASGELNKSMDDFHKILNHNPAHLKALNNLAATYFAQGKTDLAIQEYTKALTMKPSDFLYYNRSLAYLKLKFYNEAYQDTLSAKRMGFNINDEEIKKIEQLINQR